MWLSFVRNLLFRYLLCDECLRNVEDDGINGKRRFEWHVRKQLMYRISRTVEVNNYYVRKEILKP